MDDVFRTIIVTTEYAPEARLKAAETPGGEGMFTTPLSPTGELPATHYISSGYIPLVEGPSLLPATDQIDTSEEPPFEAMERLGLQLIQADISE